MYTNIYLIRHAKVDYIPDKYSRSLSKKGKEDVLKLTEAFKKYEISRVLSSPYLRTINMVEGIAKDKGIVIEKIDEFKERKIASGHIEDFASFTKKQWDNFDYCLKDGETLNEVQVRGINALNKILEKYSGENIIIGTHRTILGVILNHFDSKYNYEFWKSMRMPKVIKLSFKERNI